MEVEPLTTITTEKVLKFIWKSIISKFGIPRELVSDNRTRFASRKAHDMCQELGIRLIFSSVEHPQMNGQAEAANKVILQGLKKKAGRAKARWVEVLPEIIWSYHMTVQSTTKETPFSLVYGTEFCYLLKLKYHLKEWGISRNKSRKKGDCFI